MQKEFMICKVATLNFSFCVTTLQDTSRVKFLVPTYYDYIFQTCMLNKTCFLKYLYNFVFLYYFVLILSVRFKALSQINIFMTISSKNLMEKYIVNKIANFTRVKYLYVISFLFLFLLIFFKKINKPNL